MIHILIYHVHQRITCTYTSHYSILLRMIVATAEYFLQVDYKSAHCMYRHTTRTLTRVMAKLPKVLPLRPPIIIISCVVVHFLRGPHVDTNYK